MKPSRITTTRQKTNHWLDTVSSQLIDSDNEQENDREIHHRFSSRL